MAIYSIKKCRRILQSGCKVYKRKRHKLPESEKRAFEKQLEDLDRVVLSKERVEADRLARQLEAYLKVHFPKSLFEYTLEIVFALLFAIVVAFAIRQFWFELYQVPTGSMRPTIEELDRLAVSKTTFGIKVPFVKDLLFYKSDYIKRAGIIVLTVEGMDVIDSDTVYFYIFPGKKRFVKRCVGKPGDTLYFYGGRIYGVDKEGNPITELADENYLKKIGIEKIDHIPYITFEGKTALSNPLAHGIYGKATFSQMNMPEAKLSLEQGGKISGLFYNGKEWVRDNPTALKEPHTQPESYSDLWGIGNYAMARLLTRDQVKQFYKEYPEEAALYLELRHTPNLTYPAPEIRRGDTGKIAPAITPSFALIPLSQEHLASIQKALFTSRFNVQEGRAFPYTEGGYRPQQIDLDPRFPGVPNGCYEFYYGKGYQVHSLGIMTELPENHPLYNSSPENIQKLFNLGIKFNLLFQPMAPNQPFNPQRFAYYREGDLYLMGAPILKQDDPTLVSFVDKEMEKQKQSSAEKPYIAFVDRGPPLKNGEIDQDFILAFGLKVPDEGLVALGDNYSNSGDSREFGFVPTMNLRGAPSFTFWPPSSRVGPLPQAPYPWFTLPNCLIWGLVILIVIACILYFRHRRKKPLFKRDIK